MSILSSSEADTFHLLVRERHALIQQMLMVQPAGDALESGVEALLNELVFINEAPVRTGAGRRKARRQLRLGLEELLDRCDRLSVSHPEIALNHASDYMAFGRIGRARRLLENTLLRFESRHDIRRELARVLMASKHFNRALVHLEILCCEKPDEPELHRESAKAAIRCLSIDKAKTHLEHVARLVPDDMDVIQELAVVQEVHQVKRSASLPNTVPSISLPVDGGSSGPAQELRLAVAEQLYRQYGTLVIHNVFDPDLIDRCHEQYLSAFEPLIHADMRTQRGLPGTRRLKIRLAIDGEFNSPDFYANEFVIRLMNRLLGPQFIVGSQAALTVLPGAQDQEGEVYHRALFAQHPDDKPLIMPPTAVRCLVPLVQVDGMSGTIAVKKGSQRLSRKTVRKMRYQVPVMPIGSCCLADASLTQKMQGNRTERLSTIVDLVYQRSWFVDRQNFRNQPPLNITGVEYSRIPGRLRKLFDWAMQPSAEVGSQAHVG